MWRYEMFFSCLCMFCFLLAVLSGTCLNCAKLSIITDMGKEKPHFWSNFVYMLISPFILPQKPLHKRCEAACQGRE